MSDSKKKSILKTISWRLTATSIATLVIYLFTKSIKLGMAFALVDIVIKSFAYYIHERIWTKL